MEEMSRRTRLRVTYAGTDITAHIAGMITSFAVTDNASDTADDLELTLEDRDGNWHGAWFPGKGAEISASLECSNFTAPGEKIVYPCGAFTIDEIDVGGPPWNIILRGVSSTIMKSLRREEKTKAWENIALKEIVREIAASHDLGVLYDAPDIDYKRIDQRKESDLKFISRLAKDGGLKTKVAENRIIVFAAERFDAKPSGLTLRPEDLSSWSFRAQAHDIYRACKVDYWGEQQKESLTYTFEPFSERSVGQVLKINKRVESRADAERVAKARLRDKLEEEITGNLQMMGEPRMFAGNTISLSGFGILSGRYFLKKVRHTFDESSGYRTTADIRLAIDEVKEASEPAESDWAQSTNFGKGL